MKYVRTLFNHELHLYEKHLLDLDHNDRHFRFCGQVTEEIIKKHCQNIKNYTLVGGFDDYKLVACACILWGDNDKSVELAITVKKEYQNNGYGYELLKYAINSCSNRGVTRIYMNCLSNNKRIVKLVSKLGMKIEQDSNDCMAYMEVPKISYMTYWKELFHEYFGNYQYNKSTFKKLLLEDLL